MSSTVEARKINLRHGEGNDDANDVNDDEEDIAQCI